MAEGVKHAGSPDHRDSLASAWLVIGGLTAFFLAWGLFVFFAVGDKEPAAWYFGVQPDVPGISIYSTHSVRGLAGEAPLSSTEPVGVTPQHVRDKPQPPPSPGRIGARP